MSPVATSESARTLAVVRAVSAVMDVPVDLIASDNRCTEAVRARRIAMYIARFDLGMTYPAIGRAFQRDHTVCISGIRAVQKMLVVEEVANAIAEVRSFIAQGPKPCARCAALVEAVKGLQRQLDLVRIAMGAA